MGLINKEKSTKQHRSKRRRAAQSGDSSVLHRHQHQHGHGYGHATQGDGSFVLRPPVLLTLDMLKPGEKARIRTVGGEKALRRHLLDMGLTPNTLIMVRKVAPLGDPIELYLRNFELTLRKEDARQISIEEVAK